MLGSVGASEVLDDHEILANNKDEKGLGDDRAGETEEHPDSEVDNNPDIVISQTLSVTIGPSGVRALPLAAGINVGGHYKWHCFLFFLSLFSPAHC